MPGLVEHLADQRAANACSFAASLRCCGGKLLLHALPGCAIEDRLVLTRIARPLVPDLADIDRVRQQRIQRPAREWLAANTGAIALTALL